MVAAAIAPVLPGLGMGALLLTAPMAWADGGAGGGGAAGGTGIDGEAGNGVLDALGGGGGASGGTAAGAGGSSGTSSGGAGGTAASRDGQGGTSGDPSMGNGGGGGGGGAHGIVSASDMTNGTSLSGGLGGYGGDAFNNGASSVTGGGGGGGAGGYGAVLSGTGLGHGNDSTITAGSGGRGGQANLSSSGVVTGALTALSGTGGTGGTGVLLSGDGSTLANGGVAAIFGGQGGDGYAGASINSGQGPLTAATVATQATSGAGGTAVQLLGDGMSVVNQGQIVAGHGGYAATEVNLQGQAAPGYSSSVTSTATAGAGGAGLRLDGASGSLDNTASGSIVGGNGGTATSSGLGYFTDANGYTVGGKSGMVQTALGGRGGDGVRAEGVGATLTNAGSITGGTGGQVETQTQGVGATGNGNASAVGTSGSGGDGAHFSAQATVVNAGQITGGSAGTVESNLYAYGNNGVLDGSGGGVARTSIAGDGGNGVHLTAGSLTNQAAGVITGGAASPRLYGYSYSDAGVATAVDATVGGSAGAGVNLVGGKLANAGVIMGGAAIQQLLSYQGPAGNSSQLVDGATLTQTASHVATGAIGGVGVHVVGGSVVNQSGATISGGAASGQNEAYSNGLYIDHSGGPVTGVAVSSVQNLVGTAGVGGAGLVMDGAGTVQNAGLIQGGAAGQSQNQNSAHSYHQSSGGWYWFGGLNNFQGTLAQTSTSVSKGYAGGAGVVVAAGSVVNEASGAVAGGEVTDGATLTAQDYVMSYAAIGGSGALTRSDHITSTATGGAAGHGAVVSGTGSLRNEGTVTGGTSNARIEGNTQVSAYIGNQGANDAATGVLNSAVTGGAGGDGVRASGTASIANLGAITGGNSANRVQRSANLTLNEDTGLPANGSTASATGAVVITGGAGGAGANLSGGATLSNSGSLQGGHSLDGFSLALTSDRYNNATATGSLSMAVRGGAGGAGAQLSGGRLINSGTVTGGNGGGIDLAGTQAQDNIGDTLSLRADAGAGGAGVHLAAAGPVSVYNQAGGTLQGGDGGAVTNAATGNVAATGLAVGVGGAGLDGADATVINAGTIRGGLGGDGVRANAILFTGGVNKLTIEAGSNIVGNVQAFSRADSFGLGGATDASFDISLLGDTAQYRGFGQIEKTGSSKWTLTGSNDDALDFTVRQGRLASNASMPHTFVTIASGGTLAGNGTVGGIAAQSGAMVAPGNGIGTLSVNGNYSAAAGSLYQVEYDGTASDLISIGGSATIAAGAGLQAIHAGSAPIPLNVRYTVVTAAGGVTGKYTLSGETVASPFVTLHDSYDANNVYLEAEQTAPLVPGVTPLAAIAAGYTVNQTAIGLAAQRLAVTNGLRQALIYQPTVAAARAAFDQLSGEVHASLKTALVEDSRFVRDAANDRLLGAFCAPGAGAMATTTTQPATGGNCDPAVGHDAWGKVYGSTGRFKGDGNAQRLYRDIGGFLVGADTLVGSGWRVGGLAGYSRSTVDNVRNSSVKSDDYTLGVYAGNRWNDTSVRFGASHTWHKLDTQRSVAFSGFADNLHAKYDAGTSQAFGEIGQRIGLGTVALEPFAGLAYVRVKTDAFAERGGLAALHGRSDATDATFGALGVRASTSLTDSTRLHGMVGWRHSFSGQVASSDNAFAGSSPFTAYGVPLARNVAVLEAGVETQLRPDLTLGASYSGQFGSGLRDHGFKVTLGMKF